MLSSADHGHAAASICSCSFPTTTFFVTALMCRKPPRHHRARPQELFRYFQNRLAPSSLPQKCCCFPWAACCKSDGPIPQFIAGCHYDNFLQLILLETLRILTNRTANKKHSSFSIHLYHNCCAFGRGRPLPPVCEKSCSSENGIVSMAFGMAEGFRRAGFRIMRRRLPRGPSSNTTIL